MPKSMSKNRPTDSLHLRLAPGKKLSPNEAKKRLLEFIRDGLSVEEACNLVGKTSKTFYYYTQSDPDFNRDLKLIRALHSRKGQIAQEDRDVTFEEFRQKYLNQQTFPHQRNMIDMIESDKPSWLHDSMVFEQGLPQYVLVNMPPEHAKSMTVSIDYVTYRICIDPNVRIKLVSKTQQMAK